MPARNLIVARSSVPVSVSSRPSAPYPAPCFSCQAVPVWSRALRQNTMSSRLWDSKRTYARATSSGGGESYKPPPGSATQTRAEQLLEASKTIAMGGFVLGGVLVMGGLLWTIGSELTSDSSATKVYHDLLEQMKQFPEVDEVVGLPIRGFHEHGTKARSVRRVNHQITEDGQKMFIKFYIEGPKARATVTSEVHLKPDNTWAPYVLYFESPGEGLPSKRVFLVDQRPPVKTDKNRRRGGSRGQAHEGFEGGGRSRETGSGIAGSWLPKLGVFDRKQ